MIDTASGVETRLTEGKYDISPQWSPDGRRVAFASVLNKAEFDKLAKEGGLLTQWHYYAIPASGGEPKRLTPAGGFGLSWSPDGQRITYSSGLEDPANMSAEVGLNSSAIFVMMEGAAETLRVTGVAGHDGPPIWSPDGAQILYTSNPTDGRNSRGNWDIWLMRADGEAKRNLSDHPAADTDPIWSVDGAHVIYRCAAKDSPGLRILTIATGERRSISPTSPFDTPLFCTPDSRVIFAANTAVWSMDFDGERRVHLADVDNGFAVLRDGDVAISADGQTLAYVRRGDIWLTSSSSPTGSRLTTGGDRMQLSFAPR